MLSAPRATSFFHSTAPRCSLHSEPAAFRTLYFCPLTQHLYMPFPLPGTESFTFSSSGGGGSPKSEPPLRASHTRSGHTPPAKGSSSSALVSVPGLGTQPPSCSFRSVLTIPGANEPVSPAEGAFPSHFLCPQGHFPSSPTPLFHCVPQQAQPPLWATVPPGQMKRATPSFIG